jgi:hypothetical protein
MTIAPMTSFPIHVHAAPLAGHRPPNATQRSVARFAAVLVVLALVGCGGGDDDGDAGGGDGGTSTDDLVEVMVDSGAPEDIASCVAEKLDGVSASDLRDFLSDVGSGEDVDATSGTGKSFLNASAECNLAD